MPWGTVLMVNCCRKTDHTPKQGALNSTRKEKIAQHRWITWLGFIFSAVGCEWDMMSWFEAPASSWWCTVTQNCKLNNSLPIIALCQSVAEAEMELESVPWLWWPALQWTSMAVFIWIQVSILWEDHTEVDMMYHLGVLSSVFWGTWAVFPVFVQSYFPATSVQRLCSSKPLVTVEAPHPFASRYIAASHQLLTDSLLCPVLFIVDYQPTVHVSIYF